MLRLLVLLLGILPAITSAGLVPNPCNGPWVNAIYQYGPAQSYCANNHPPKAVTKTFTAHTRTLTSTVATVTSTQILPGVITSTVATAPATTVIAFTTVFATNTVTITSTFSTTSTSTSTATASSTTSVRSISAAIVKRGGLAGAEAWRQLQYKGQAAIREACFCIQAGHIAKTVTVTPTATVRATATTTRSVSSVLRTTLTPTVTSTLTITTAAAPVTTTTITTSVSIEVATTTTTSIATVVITPPKCNPNAQFGQRGAGGCSNNCYCDRDIEGINYYCDSSIFCLGDCQSDADCPSDQFCATGTSCSSTGSRTCQKYSDCTSSFIPNFRRNVALDAVPAMNHMPVRDVVANGDKELSHSAD